MSRIDFDHLDGRSSVASEREGRLGKLALPLLLAVGAGVLAYVNWPGAQQTSALIDGTGRDLRNLQCQHPQFSRGAGEAGRPIRTWCKSR
jgi:hypothetical protein